LQAVDIEKQSKSISKKEEADVMRNKMKKILISALTMTVSIVVEVYEKLYTKAKEGR